MEQIESNSNSNGRAILNCLRSAESVLTVAGEPVATLSVELVARLSRVATELEDRGGAECDHIVALRTIPRETLRSLLHSSHELFVWTSQLRRELETLDESLINMMAMHEDGERSAELNSRIIRRELATRADIQTAKTHRILEAAQTAAVPQPE